MMTGVALFQETPISRNINEHGDLPLGLGIDLISMVRGEMEMWGYDL